MNVTIPSIQLSDRHIFLGTQAKKILKGSKKDNKEALVLLKSMRKACESAAASILSKMPLMNPLLKALSAFDSTIPTRLAKKARLDRRERMMKKAKSKKSCNELLKLPELVANVLLTVEEKGEYEQQPTKL